MKEKWYKPYDSPEEAYTSWYLDELGNAGYISEYAFQPESFSLFAKCTYQYSKQLKTKKKILEVAILQEHLYTPDFRVLWSDRVMGVLFKNIENVGLNKGAPFWAMEPPIYDNELLFESIWEVKPLFDRNNMTRLFTINQKWMYSKYGIYVQKIIPQKLFKYTFTPKKYLLTDMGKQKRKIIFEVRTLEEYVKLRKNN